jgi:oxygen-independent coproporphyrinogen III oxidase
VIDTNLNMSSEFSHLNPSQPWIVPRAAYLHIPFCAHKCGYCDFASVAGQDDLADRYLIALEAEIRRSLSSRAPVDTIFVGGGTPTRLNASQLFKFCEITRQYFELAPHGEWTVEAAWGLSPSTQRP